MLKIILIAMTLFSIKAFAAECAEIAKYDEDKSEIYVVCPNLDNLSDSEISKAISTVFASRGFVPDEYTIDFVLSAAYLTQATLTKDNHIGFYYTHDNQLVIWPKNSGKKRVVQLGI
jgi:hypothetical protein